MVPGVALVVVRGSVELDQATRTALTDLEANNQEGNQLAFLSWLYSFFVITSCNICLSRVKSARSCLRRWFSFSSGLRRRNSGTPRLAYLRRQR